VLDNVIILRNVLAHERRRRTVEIVKMRGTAHRTGEWLFTIDPRDGFVVIPLAFLVPPFAAASLVRVSSGNTELDRMCGDGFFKDAIVRHEAPFDRAEVKGLRRLAVAAAGPKLRAA
jgi:circadian clock protein KaiC